jgi:DNA helicase-2/ATP-dependent DNA helicase PcrA
MHNQRRRLDLPRVPSTLSRSRQVSTATGEAATAILDHLDPEQRAVALTLEGPVCVLAGAGTGKTRAITHRIAYGIHTGVYQPSEVLAVTFTTRAAGEMRSRLSALGAPGAQARTFHSAALRQARYFWPRVYGSDLPALAESKLPLLSQAARQCRIQPDTTTLRDVASEIEWAKVSNVRPEDYERVAGPAGRRLANLDLATTARVFAAYEEIKRERRRIDMEDVLLCAAVLLAEDERCAAVIRRQYRWLVVDEFQDVNAVQQRLLDLWLGTRDDVCVVGDPAQTIYSFAGASPDHLLGFSRRYPDAPVIRLDRNYRSTPEVVAAANALLEPTRSANQGVVLRSQCKSGPSVRFQEHPDEVTEAEAVAAAIKVLGDQRVPWGEIAVLFRVNAQSEAFEAALTECDVPYVVRGVERFFERPEVRQAMTLMRGALRAGEPPGQDLVADVEGVLTSMGWSAQAPAGAGASRNRWESLRALVGLAEEVRSVDPSAELRTFVEEVERRAASQQAPKAEGVTLATLHAAKGLEWDHVFVAGVHEGTVPITYAATPSAVEEERRLLYVGLTRAREGLTLSWSLARAPGARPSRGASRFLACVFPGAPDARPVGRTRRRRSKGPARCRVCQRPLGDAVERKLGRCQGCPSSYDELLYSRLRTWRTERSAEEKVPAYCVFTDATLTVIAETRPRDAAALVRIPGIGKAKLDKYGPEILTLCAPD